MHSSMELYFMVVPHYYYCIIIHIRNTHYQKTNRQRDKSANEIRHAKKGGQAVVLELLKLHHQWQWLKIQKDMHCLLPSCFYEFNFCIPKYALMMELLKLRNS